MNIIATLHDFFFSKKIVQANFFFSLKITIIEINRIRLVQFFCKSIIQFYKSCVQKMRKLYLRESEIFNKVKIQPF